jgi:DGQHR domain-containing protein
MIPNAVVVAFDDRVKFKPDPARPDELGYLRRGVLVIPADPETPDEEKAGFVVDGQQRLAAIRDATVTSFPIVVSAFITNDQAQQTEQFILVNSTKPLHKGLIYELLPATKTTLPSALQRRRFPAVLLERLNLDEGSPLKGMIQTQTNPWGTIKDNSILKMLEHSLSDGALYRLRGRGVGGSEGDTDGMLDLLRAFWGAVARVFPEAWALPAKKSRLVHGAGIVSLGFVMDAICDRLGEDRTPTTDEIEEDLTLLAPACAWTDGEWDFGPRLERKWNEVQNVPKDVDILSNYLLVKYKELVRGKKPVGSR